jgi:hypothetical protein
MCYRGKSRRFFNDRPSLEVDENTARSDVSKVSSKELLYTAIGGVLFLLRFRARDSHFKSIYLRQLA